MNTDQYLLNIPSQKIKYGLSRTKKLLKTCNNPEKDMFTIQIVGTNGKGSTCAFLNNIFISAQYKVGLFTSPHLIDYKERIQINNKQISSQEVAIFLKQHKDNFQNISPSFFEIMTVMALWYFKRSKVDLAILETGLGGKLDSVTACNNQIVGFTSIDLDHQEIVGKTIQDIAIQKSSAVQEASQVAFSIKQQKAVGKILNKRCKKQRATYFDNIPKTDYNCKHLQGTHQKYNAGLAQAIAKHCSTMNFFNIKDQNIKKGLDYTKWPGRFEILNIKPTIIFDVAHNNAGIKSFIQTYLKYIKSGNYATKYILCGFEANKEIQDSIILLNNLFDKIICTETGIRKSKKCGDFLQFFDISKRKSIKHVGDAFTYLQNNAQKNDIICVLGSHFFGPYIYEQFNKSFAYKE